MAEIVSNTESVEDKSRLQAEKSEQDTQRDITVAKAKSFMDMFTNRQSMEQQQALQQSQTQVQGLMEQLQSAMSTPTQTPPMGPSQMPVNNMPTSDVSRPTKGMPELGQKMKERSDRIRKMVAPKTYKRSPESIAMSMARAGMGNYHVIKDSLVAKQVGLEKELAQMEKDEGLFMQAERKLAQNGVQLNIQKAGQILDAVKLQQTYQEMIVDASNGEESSVAMKEIMGYVPTEQQGKLFAEVSGTLAAMKAAGIDIDNKAAVKSAAAAVLSSGDYNPAAEEEKKGDVKGIPIDIFDELDENSQNIILGLAEPEGDTNLLNSKAIMAGHEARLRRLIEKSQDPEQVITDDDRRAYELSYLAHTTDRFDTGPGGETIVIKGQPLSSMFPKTLGAPIETAEPGEVTSKYTIENLTDTDISSRITTTIDTIGMIADLHNEAQAEGEDITGGLGWTKAKFGGIARRVGIPVSPRAKKLQGLLTVLRTSITPIVMNEKRLSDTERREMLNVVSGQGLFEDKIDLQTSMTLVIEFLESLERN